MRGKEREELQRPADLSSDCRPIQTAGGFFSLVFTIKAFLQSKGGLRGALGPSTIISVISDQSLLITESEMKRPHIPVCTSDLACSHLIYLKNQKS